MKEEDIQLAKAILAESESPGPLRRNIPRDERAKTFRWAENIFEFIIILELVETTKE